jgi:hypothetical protein
LHIVITGTTDYIISMEKHKLLKLVKDIVIGHEPQPFQSDHYIKEHWLGHQVIQGVMQADEAYEQLSIGYGKEPFDAA